MNKRHKQRLLKLADLLDSTKELPKKFNLETWNCGTSACAVGHACLSSKFPGLILDDWGSPALTNDDCIEGWEAVEKYFGLDDEEAHFLFAYTSYESGNGTRAKTVANRIREFIA